MQDARTVRLEDLEHHLDRNSIRRRVRDAIIAHSKGKVISPMPGQLRFDDPVGDCHIKFCSLLGGPRFVVKVATGFYDNPNIGLPVNSGTVLVLSAKTGHVEAVMFDQGWLTSWRTAAAGSLASRAMAREDGQIIAILGSGHQAELQAIWHADVFPGAEFVIGARAPHKAEKLAAQLREAGLNTRAEQSIRDAVAGADVIVTTTPASAPLFSAEVVSHGAHVTALGSDSHGKQELDPQLLAKASLIATDDHAQCIDHSEFGIAYRLGLVAEDQDVSLGRILDSNIARNPGDITVADLTGIAAEDIAIASFFLDKL
jgi:ornithine cyclodeaminase